LAWWSILLYTKNRDAYNAKIDLIRSTMKSAGIYENEELFRTNEIYILLTQKYKKQEYMIFGEAALFMLTLIVGIWLMNRGLQREIRVANQQKNFLLSITHELKSPIASIRLVLDTFRKRTLADSQKEQLTNNAIQDADRLNNLVNNLLLAARMDGSYEPVFETHNVKFIFSKIASNFMLRHKNCSIDCESISENLIAEFDIYGMELVLSNLIENAIKYTNSDPEIGISATSDEKNGLKITIEDNGIGIPEGEKKRIFDKFYRIGSEETRSAKGTGLGLYLVKGIITAHNGEIYIEDSKKGGSLFTIHIPLKQAKR